MCTTNNDAPGVVFSDGYRLTDDKHLQFSPIDHYKLWCSFKSPDYKVLMFHVTWDYPSVLDSGPWTCQAWRDTHADSALTVESPSAAHRPPPLDVTKTWVQMRRDGPKTYAIACINRAYDRAQPHIAVGNRMDLFSAGLHGRIPVADDAPLLDVYGELFGRHRLNANDANNDDSPAFHVDVIGWRDRACPTTWQEPTKRYRKKRSVAAVHASH